MTRLGQFDQICSENEREDVVDYSGESAIEWLRGDQMATATFPAGTRECNRLKKYAEEYPEEVKISRENLDGSIVVRFPKKYLRITRPVIRELSDEEREAAANRLREARKRNAEGKVAAEIAKP